MKVKTYLVNSLSEAVEKIKIEMGPKAVILSTKKADPKKNAWLKSKPKLEVTAAMDSSYQDFVRTEPDNSPLNQAIQVVSKLTDDKLNSLKNEINELKSTLGAMRVAGDDKSASSNTLLKTPDKLDKVSISADKNDISQVIIDICTHLLKQKVNVDIVQNLADHLTQNQALNTEEKVENAAMEYVYGLISSPVGLELKPGSPKVICVVGPTGVGKTTTLAKIAAQMKVNSTEKLVFLSTDVKRPGSVEQSERLAALLNIPFRPLYNLDDLLKALHDYSDCGAILIDTAGQEQIDIESVLVAKNITTLPSYDYFTSLVIPANMNESDVKNVIQNYRSSRYNNIIVTKLDEASCFGTLVNSSVTTKLPYSYFAVGQNIPEDIEESTKERIIDCLFSLTRERDLSADENQSIATDGLRSQSAAH